MRSRQTSHGSIILCTLTEPDLSGSSPVLSPVDAVFTPSLGPGEGRGVTYRSINVRAIVKSADRSVRCLAGGSDGVLACFSVGTLARITWSGFRPAGSTWALPAHIGPGAARRALPAAQPPAKHSRCRASIHVHRTCAEYITALVPGPATGSYYAVLSDGSVTALALPDGTTASDAALAGGSATRPPQQAARAGVVQEARCTRLGQGLLRPSERVTVAAFNAPYGKLAVGTAAGRVLVFDVDRADPFAVHIDYTVDLGMDAAGRHGMGGTTDTFVR